MAILDWWSSLSSFARITISLLAIQLAVVVLPYVVAMIANLLYSRRKKRRPDQES